MCVAGGSRRLGRARSDPQYLTGAVIPALAAHEKAHDSDVARALRLQLAHAFLHRDGVGHAERDLDLVAASQRLHCRLHAAVPFRRTAMGHDEDAECIGGFRSVSAQAHVQPEQAKMKAANVRIGIKRDMNGENCMVKLLLLSVERLQN